MAFDIKPPIKKSGKPIQPVLVKQSQIGKSKLNIASKTSVLIFGLALFLIIGAIGYIIWQEESTPDFFENNDQPAGIIRTFPGENPIAEQSDGAGANGLVDTALTAAEQRFSTSFSDLQAKKSKPVQYDQAAWEEINKYLNNF